jgi:hypothetical protein
MDNKKKNVSDLNKPVEKAFGVQTIDEKPSPKPSESNNNKGNDDKKHSSK